MKALGKKGQKRNVFDVHGKAPVSAPRPLGERFFGKNVLNLKPGLAKRYPWLAAAIFAVIVVGIFWGIRKLTTRAEVAEFYPLTCLGSWQNPANAEGEPASLSASSTVIGAANSAVYDPAADPLSQIYCGAFVPQSYQAEGNITSVDLSLAWNMPGAPAAAATGTNSSSTNAAAATNAATSTLTAPTTTSTSTSLAPFMRGLSAFFEVALADTTDTATTVPTSSGSAAPPPAPPTPPAAATSSAPASSSAQSAPPPATTTAATTTAPTLAPAPATTTEPTSSVPMPTAPSTATTTTAPAAETASSSLTATASDTASSSEPANGSAPAPAPAPIRAPAPDNNFLRVSYSLDGESWIELSTVGPTNWQNFTANIPVTSWDDLRKLQVKIEGVSTSLSEIPAVYLNGMVVAAHYEVPPALPLLSGGAGSSAPTAPSGASGGASAPIIVLPKAERPVPVNQNGNFNANQAPTFDFDLNSLQTATSGPTTSSMPILVPAPAPAPAPASTTAPTSSTSLSITANRGLSFFFKLAAQWIGDAFAGFDARIFALGRLFTAYAQTAGGQGTPQFPTANDPIVAQIFDPKGNLTDLVATTLITGGNLRVILPTPGREFMPGRYVLKLLIWQNGEIYETESNFSWGVLVDDFDKSIYTLGDTVHAGFAVLDDTGNTVCNADVSMTVTTPGGQNLSFSTQDGTLTRNSTCGHNNPTESPDYGATLKANNVGTYEVSVSATTAAGTRTITDHFDVENPPLFDVLRTAPVRIYPPSTYPVTLTVKANADYTGDIVEAVPSSFAISNVNDGGVVLPGAGGEELISWPVSLKKGDGANLEYSFLAPDISPDLYKLGPLTIGSWQESRQWQIASDFVCGFGTASGTECIGFITSTASTTWTVPSDWNSASNTIELVGGSAGGISGTKVQGAAAGEGGGGGGAYAKITDFSTSTGTSVNVIVGAGGGSDAGGSVTYFNWNGSGSTSTCSATTMSACAAAGSVGSGTTGGAGGTTAGSVGSTTYAGGAGATGGGKNGAGGGGGGAAGLHGVGGNASGATGGTGDNGTTAAGANGTEWSTSPAYGSGGGGAGGTSGGGVGGNGGTYGAGGGGGAGSGNSGGTGQNGIIVITYHPSLITLGNGAQAPNTTIGPSINATTSDSFTFYTSAGTTSITSVTVDLSTVLGVYQVEIANASGTTVYGSSTNPGFTTVNVTTTGMNVSTTTSTFITIVKTFSGLFVPGDPPGSDFVVTSTIAGWTTSNGFDAAGSNTTSSIITIDNSAPNEVTNASGTANTSSVNFSWTVPTSTDFATTTILRATSSLVGTEPWNTSANHMPTAVYAHSAVAYNGYLYITGGEDINNVVTSGVSYASISSNGSVGTWNTSPNQLPMIDANHSAAAYNGYLYVLGGETGSAITSSVFYAPISSTGSIGTWNTSPNPMPMNDIQDGAAAYNGYLYVMGGNDGTGVATSSVFYAPLSSNGSVGAWNTSTNHMPTNDFQFGAAAYNGYLYVMGGNVGSALTSSVFYAPISSDGSVGAWNTSQNQMPMSIWENSGAAYDGYLYVMGGSTSSVFYAPLSGDGSVGTWNTSPNQLPMVDRLQSSAAYNGYLYVTGGYGANTSTVTSSVFYAPLPPRPLHGTNYAVSSTIAFGNVTATVACVVASSTNSCTDSGLTTGQTYYYDIYTEDSYGNYSVGAVPTGSPFFGSTVSCSVSTTTTAFGTLSQSAVNASVPNVTTTVSCSDAAGCVLDVSDRGNTSTPGLYKSTASTYLIRSTSATLVAGTEGYGIQAATTSAGSGNALILNPTYAVTGSTVGGLSTTSIVLASSTNTFSSRQVVVTHKAAIANTTYAGSYNDTITYSCLGN